MLRLFGNPWAFLQKSDAYFSPLKVFAIRSTFWGPRDCRNSTRKVEHSETFWEWVLGIWKKMGLAHTKTFQLLYNK